MPLFSIKHILITTTGYQKQHDEVSPCFKMLFWCIIFQNQPSTSTTRNPTLNKMTERSESLESRASTSTSATELDDNENPRPQEEPLIPVSADPAFQGFEATEGIRVSNQLKC